MSCGCALAQCTNWWTLAMLGDLLPIVTIGSLLTAATVAIVKALTMLTAATISKLLVVTATSRPATAAHALQSSFMSRGRRPMKPKVLVQVQRGTSRAAAAAAIPASAPASARVAA